MNTDQINYLNIGLMLLSLAWALPFEVFLFSYALLGPLHYLTDINWLHQRDYFILRLIYLAGFPIRLDIRLPASAN